MKGEGDLPGGRTREEAGVITPSQQTCRQLGTAEMPAPAEGDAESWQAGRADAKTGF